MQPVNLFQLATQQAQWLTVRQSTVAGNIANANTPKYLAKDIQPFESVLENTRVAMGTTHPKHISTTAPTAGFAIDTVEDPNAVMPSGNSVVLEQEMLKAGEVRRAYELNTAIVKSFHRMMMSTTRG